MPISRRKRHLNEIRRKAIANSKARAAAKRLKLQTEIEQVELIENPHILPGDIDLSFITEIKSEYVEDDSLGVQFQKFSFLMPIASI